MATALVGRGDTSPFLLETATIPGLEPVGLHIVPSGKEAWEDWRDGVLNYRELVRRQCHESRPDHRLHRQVEMHLCKDDPAYWLAMYGCIFEPRGLDGRPPQWLRWIPFAFQVQMIRWIQHVMRQQEHGRGDGVIEKSREMGASWTFCAFIAHQWLFEDAFVASAISRTGDLVDKVGNSDSLFYKIRSLLGIQPQVPAHLAIPAWMRPKGFTEDHSTNKNIQHPRKTCIIMGENATEMAGVGGRATLRFNDEAARFSNFDDAWVNQAGTSNHRFAISSADDKSPGFQVLAKRGAEGLTKPHMDAPSYLRLDWWVHPFHTPEWYENEKARFADRPHWFRREYDIDYSAGAGEEIYPRFRDVRPSDVPFDPYGGQVYCTIDPGLSDPTAIAWIQHDTMQNRYRVIKAFQGIGGEDAEFITSILVGVRLSGYGGFDYSENLYPGIDELMAWTRNLKRTIQYYGDHYGTHSGGGGGASFFDTLRAKSRELTGGQHIIHVETSTKDDSRKLDLRSHEARKDALNYFAGRMDFDRSPGPAFVLSCLQNSKYPARKEGRAYLAPILKPEHDEWSHMRSAIEYWAVNLKKGEVIAAIPKQQRARRITMSGKIRK